MALEIKHVADLMGMRFQVPSYQRGYRWERKQIEQLLYDLYEFSESIERAKDRDTENDDWNNDNPEEPKRSTNNALKMGYYCLQPLAVTGNNGNYDIIDGQQRLTTIYLILCYLSDTGARLPYDQSKTVDESMYELNYQTREESFFKEKLFKNGPGSAVSNIDYYFMAKAYESIGDWFQSHPGTHGTILNLLLPTDYKTNLEKRNERLHDVRFIWYDTPQSSSIATFNNLNYGKIGLTASELVKALLFQCDVYESESRDVAKKDAFTRSTKWSLMEESLQDPYFWGMLTNSKFEKDLHLELVLDFVAQDIDHIKGYSESEGWRREDSDWVFNIFSKAISDSKFSTVFLSSMERIEYLWEEIQKVYSTVKNWFTNRRLYHWIGLLVHLKTTYEKKSHLEIIRELYEEYRKGSKPEFDTYLKKAIGSCVKIKNTTPDTIIDESGNSKTVTRPKVLSEINYEEDPVEIRKILLLFNVELLQRQSSEDSRFPFHLVSGLKSLEHIHPQHLNEDRIDFKTFKEWFLTRKEILRSNGKLRGNDDLTQAINYLDESLNDESTFENNKQECFTKLSKVDEQFDELAGMNSDVMHSMCNMALVDEPTNTALSNRLICEKREVLKSRRNESYIPIGTWYVFNKYFSSDIQDMKFWSETDRKSYYAEVEKIYNEYTK